MKKIISFISLLLITCLLLASCSQTGNITPPTKPDNGIPNTPAGIQPPGGTMQKPPQSTDTPNLGDFDESYGENLEDSDIYNGYFEDDTQDFTVTYVSGTKGAYSFEGSTLSFSALDADSVYAISGKLKGNIVIDAGQDYKLDLEFTNFSIVSDSINPITVLSGNEVSITAKSGTENYIYDNRAQIDATDTTLYSAAVYALCDLEVCGKGTLSLVSDNNNGIHTKDDLQVKNLTLTVKCKDNALKGNDSVTLESGTTTLIATAGDGIKSTNSNISEKGNQRGIISVLGGAHTIYAACDGIDASYDVIVNGDTTSLTVYTDKYSNYSEEVTETSDETYYVCSTRDTYTYKITLYNSESDKTELTPVFHSSQKSGSSTRYYYSFSKNSAYSKIKVSVYSSGSLIAESDYLTPSTGYDTIYYSQSRGSFQWTGYSSQSNGMGGMGGMQDGNTDKGTYSTKGLKAANAISILSGNITVKAYDDAIHANAELTLENGETPTGNVTLSGGTVTVYSNDDGIHADGALLISGGNITVQKSYEGLEGVTVTQSGGWCSVTSSDDGINSTAASGTGISLTGGTLYVYAGGDGIDANSTTQYSAIAFEGADVVIISTSGGNSAIDCEKGYLYKSGRVLAVMPQDAMTSEAKKCSNYTSVATEKSISLNASSYISISGAVTVKVPTEISALVIYLGSSSASISVSATTSASLDASGVKWE